MTDSEKEFINGLNDLTRKTGVTIAGCGCCGSPYLYSTKEGIEGYSYHYEIKRQEEDVENISWEKD